MFINGLGTANPPRRYTQGRMLGRLHVSTGSTLDRRSHMIARTSSRGQRHRRATLALDSLADVFAIDPDTLHSALSASMRRRWPRSRQRALRDARIGRRHRRRRHQHLHRLPVPG
jgi:hypothetical protein